MWYIQIQQDEGILSWCRFKDMLHLRFGPPLRSNPLNKLVACKRTGTGHNRVCKRLFLLEGVVEDDEDVEEGNTKTSPHLSLHAITGVHFSDMMQIQVALGDTSLIALLDSGSTHNFISEAAAQRTGLPLQHHPHLMATVANGERVSCLGIIR
ncbi:uncharacterized protein [Miscanthus floridulus]|uniref:uncharacterized protein n=1 Tax=Miscanthus floridulus TaxID=154761 RepID=UPI003457BEDF